MKNKQSEIKKPTADAAGFLFMLINYCACAGGACAGGASFLTKAIIPPTKNSTMEMIPHQPPRNNEMKLRPPAMTSRMPPFLLPLFSFDHPRKPSTIEATTRSIAFETNGAYAAIMF